MKSFSLARYLRGWLLSSFLLLAFATSISAADSSGAIVTNYSAGRLQVLTDNGAWSWFMDPRVIVDNDRLIAGSARANGTFQDRNNPGWGDIELPVLDLTSGAVRVVVLCENFEQDDHCAPGKLHPTIKGYQVWADALKPIFTDLLGPPTATDHAPPLTGDPSQKRSRRSTTPTRTMTIAPPGQ